MSLDHIDPFPWFLNKTLKFQISDHEVETKITATQWTDHWRPFLARLRALWIAAQPRRVMVAIAGPPGSGKSVLAEQLHWITSRGIIDGDVQSIALPMDGFHYPQAYLETHTRELSDGTKIPLDSVKGQIDTFDVLALRKGLKLLAARIADLRWPGYSRITHDVVPNRFTVHRSANLVFVEGNYLLLNKGRFTGIPNLFDLRVYIDIPAAKIVGNLMARHMAGGKTLDEAKEWVKHNDLPNARIVEATIKNADVVIERDVEAGDLTSITWPDRAAAPPVAAPPAAAPAADAANPAATPPPPPTAP